MNSFKSTITVLFLLGVSYGVYRLIHTPDPTATGNGSFFVALGPATPSSKTGDASLDSSTKSAQAAPSGAMPPMTMSLPPPSVPNFDAHNSTLTAPALDAGGSKPPSLYQTGTNSLTKVAPAKLPAAKLIPTVPSSQELATVGGTSTSLEPLASVSGKTPPVMTGPLTPVAPGSLANNKKIESAPPGSASNPSGIRTVAPEMIKPALPAIAPPGAVQELKSVWPIVDAQVRKGEIAQSLQLLSGYYHANLAEADRVELLKWLDALAFKVIYSTEHRLVATPHVVRAGETLESIAKDWSIPPDLLMNINRSRIPANNTLTEGLELKIVRGPFRAEIDSQRKELTLFLDRYYAGRFAIDTSNCLGLTPGQLAVQSLRVDSPGQYQLNLAGGISLVAGMPPTSSSAIQMNVADAKDVFGILSPNSQVSVIR